MADRMSSHIEGRLAFLHVELGVTESQEPKWEAFADAVRANAKAARDRHRTAERTSGEMDLPHRLDVEERALSGHLDAIRRIRTAIEPLYAVLSEDQRRVADELMVGPMGFVIM